MRKALVFILGVCLLALFAGSVSARDIDKSGKQIMKAVADNENPLDIDAGARDLMMAAAVDSYCVVWYDFEQMNWQNWTTLDNTAQIEIFFHVDDFAGLGGGSYGYLVPLEGTKSMWCGTRPNSDARAYAPDWYLCSWIYAPGYGNSWNQLLTTGAVPFTGLLTFSYKITWDSEPDFDFTTIEYDAGDNNWVEIAEYDADRFDSTAVHQLLLSQVATKLRFHFVADGAWSDQDGLWNTDGACIIDSITVADATGLINYENWEGEALDAKVSQDGFWTADEEDPFGAYVGLANNLLDKDPCGDNFASQIIFYQGSGFPSGDYPGLYDTPFCKGPGQTTAPCQDESLVSPVIDLTLYSSNCDEVQDTPIPGLANMGGLVYRFTTYRDLPLANLVFYTWGIRSIDETGCPGQWKDRNFVYYGPDKDFIQGSFDVSDLFESDEVQFTIGVADMCDVWFDEYGDCAAHTPSPWIDNVRVYRYETYGPQWSWRDLDIFQDNFPEEEFNISSWVRADIANDLRAGDDPVIDPGDSAVVTCSAPIAGGLDTLVTGEPKVYCHVWAEAVDPLKSDLFGPTLQGTYGTYVSDDAAQWTIFHCPVALAGGNPAQDKYMIDLNDSLFTRGYVVWYYFKAWDLNGASSTLPRDAETGGNMFEWTCLPTLNSGILFVDDFHGRGTFEGTVQTYFDPAFESVIPGDEMPDRYDVNNPSSLVSNGPGSRAKQYQLALAYEKIVWDSGNLNSGTITEGTSWSDKSDDAQMLVDWLDLTEHKVGLWVLGDDVAYDLSQSPAASALALMSTYCGVSCLNDGYYDLTGGREAGGVVTPQITGVSGGIYDGMLYYAFGGCPIINAFDVIETTGGSSYSLQYPDFNSIQYYAGISNSQTNSAGQPMRTSWIGHSFMYVRDGGTGVLARNELVDKTWAFFENDRSEDITNADIPATYALMQNYPNPFNPTTIIKFNLPVKGHVSMKIYNVAGQLIRTLTDEVWEAGSQQIEWNGTNDLGGNVASGVYFYKIKAADFESTRKMILLK